MKIVIIDKIGLCYDGKTLNHQGLGGSESAVILMSRELVKLGFEVTVFNNCADADRSGAGTYDGVRYIDISEAPWHQESYDIAIVSRVVAPFIDADKQFPMIHSARRRVLWMHDTFVDGETMLEQLVVSGKIHHVFTLSDWHTTYVLNCDHGQRRNYEVLKRKVFQTRNGAVCHIPEVDLRAKDPMHFVYNASATKGMVPLLDLIWPRIRAALPQARLTVIGGFYRFRTGAEPDAQENTVTAYAARKDLADAGVTFTGVIPQAQIASILANAYMMLYPGAFPETFGISTLESLLYKTPLVTTRFGALEETAVANACYMIDYPVVPNSLFKNIDTNAQVDRFVQTVLSAHANQYLHQQKQNYCDVVKDVASWASVALQWKQFLYRSMDLPLSRDEYREVERINTKVARVFGRVNHMPSVQRYTSSGEQHRIVIISPVWNAESYIKRHILSVASQDYDNYLHVIINDASTDRTLEIATQTVNSLPVDIAKKIIIKSNAANLGAIYNQLTAVDAHVQPTDIVMLLDGDDWLVPNNTLFHYYNDLYHQGYEFTYGSMWSAADQIPLVAQEYPQEIRNLRAYRAHRFNWGIPYTHLRTCVGWLFSGLDRSVFLDDTGEWMRAGADNPLFYELIQQANPARIYCNREIVCVYNDQNPLNDYKVRAAEQNANAARGGTKYHNQFSVVIPTMWRAPNLTHTALNDYVAHDLIREIIIIDNDPKHRPSWPVLSHDKIVILSQTKNIGVNPAWNLGIQHCRNNLVCIANDDIVVDTGVFARVLNHYAAHPDSGVLGLITGERRFNHPQPTDWSIDFRAWRPGDNIHGFGQFMFVRKNTWVDIPNELMIYYGDDVIFQSHLAAGRTNYVIYNCQFESPMAGTTRDTSITQGRLEAELPIFQRWASLNPIAKTETIMSDLPKRILIAVPTNKYIEPETFKSIYDLEVPPGYTTEFQFFYGYQIDQIRNLIAEWGKKYDYLMCVDSDIVLPADALIKMIRADVDIISGLYIQRIPNTHTLELYRSNNRGGVENIPIQDIQGKQLVSVDACGFGCVLIKSKVLLTIPYPHFVYHSAIDHRNTVSEDIHFCKQARDHGFKIWAHTEIRCDHIGSTRYAVQLPGTTQGRDASATLARFTELRNQRLLPAPHVDYLRSMSATVQPRVIYDIGSCVLHWTDRAREIWPGASYYLFDAMKSLDPLYRPTGHSFFLGPLSDADNKPVSFYMNEYHPGGNSYYKETTGFFTEEHRVEMRAWTLDTVVSHNNWALPDLIKLDCQGSELDILRGATRCLAHATDVILEAQHTDYNHGAPKVDQVIQFMIDHGFTLISNFTSTAVDGDYHFRRIINL